MPLTQIKAGALANSLVTSIKIADGEVQTVDIGTGQVTSAKLENNIVLPGNDSVTVPKGTVAQRGAAVAGKLRYNTDDNAFEGYNGTAWSPVGGGATGGGSDAVFFENDQTVTTNYTLTANKNAVSAGNITINGGVTVTVPTGARWVVV